MALPALDTMDVTIRVEEREDGGIQVTSGDVLGLLLSGKDRAQVWSVVGVAVQRLLTTNHGVQVVSVEGPMVAPETGDVQIRVVHLRVVYAVAA